MIAFYLKKVIFSGKLSRLLFLCLLSLFFAASPLIASAADKTQKAAEGDLPTTITASKMRYDANKQQVVFEGNVKVRRPDFDLDSNKLTIFFQKKTQPKTALTKKSPSGETPNGKAPSENVTDDPLSTMGAGDIDKLIAEGKVLMVRDGRTGTCEKITYYVPKELIVMEGSPVLKEKDNSVTGQIINFYVKENRSEVLGGSNAPVQVRFTSPKNSEEF